jgi:hypothetical protein
MTGARSPARTAEHQPLSSLIGTTEQGKGQHLKNLLDRLGKASAALIDWEFFTIDGHDICRIGIDPSDHPVFEAKGEQRLFWWRTPVSTERIDDEQELDRLMVRRWSPG